MPHNKRNVRIKHILLPLLLAMLCSCKSTREIWPTEDWQVAAPGEVGMDPELVQGMWDEIETSGINLDGVVVVHQGVIVAERYYPVYSQDTLHESYSITRVSSLLWWESPWKKAAFPILMIQSWTISQGGTLRIWMNGNDGSRLNIY